MAERERTSSEETYQGNGRSPAEIEENIARTRADMDETLSALERKLSPGELIDEFLRSWRGGPGEFTHNLGRSVRDNPLPVTLVGIGLGWLMAAGREGGAAAGTGYGTRLREKMGQAREGAAGYRESLGAKTGEAGETLAGYEDRLREQGEKFGEALHRTREKGSEILSRAEETAGRLGERSRTASHDLSNMLKENPLLLGFAGVTLGALVAAAFPTTQGERELAGELEEKLEGKFRKPIEESVESVKEVARQTAETAREEAGKQGLTSEEEGRRLH